MMCYIAAITHVVHITSLVHFSLRGGDILLLDQTQVRDFGGNITGMVTGVGLVGLGFRNGGEQENATLVLVSAASIGQSNVGVVVGPAKNVYVRQYQYASCTSHKEDTYLAGVAILFLYESWRAFTQRTISSMLRPTQAG